MDRSDRIRRIYYPSIDTIKGLAIFSVLLLHIIPEKLLIYTFPSIHINQAVPVFIVIMGMTLMITFRRSDGCNNIKFFYNTSYFDKKILRIIYPYLIVFIVSFLWGVWNHDYYLGILSLVGFLPVTGPGNYYVSILITFIFIAPIIAYFYYRNQWLTIASMVIMDLSFQFLSPYIWPFNGDSYLYSACILRYFSAIAIGLYISDEFLQNGHIDMKNKKYWPILLFVPVSVLYLLLGVFIKQPFPLFNSLWGTQNIISFAYTMLIVIVLLNLEISHINNALRKVVTLIGTLGKASYHIFLVQTLFFGFGFSLTNLLTRDNMLYYGGFAIMSNLVLIIGIGLVFYRFEPILSGSVNRHIKLLFSSFMERVNYTR
jgi:hypothetical protein